MRISRLITAAAAASAVAVLAFAPAAQAAHVVASGTRTVPGGEGCTKVTEPEKEPFMLAGFTTAKKTSGSKCISARTVLKTSSNAVVATGATATSCTTGRTVQASIPTVKPDKVAKAVLEVRYAGGSKSTRTFGIG